MKSRRSSTLAAFLFLITVVIGVILGFFVDQETIKKWRDQILNWLE